MQTVGEELQNIVIVWKKLKCYLKSEMFLNDKSFYQLGHQ